MPLESKYLKYDKSITLEIFKKIISKLTELYGESNRWEKSYENFKKDWGFIVIFNDAKRCSYNWSIDNNKQNCTEITVQEILGYDPFVSVNINEVLMEAKQKYPIGTKYEYNGENIVLGDLKISTHVENINYISDGCGSCVWHQLEGWSKIISFEKVIEEVIPEYVECIGKLQAFDLGKIYKTEKYPEGSYRVVCHDNGGQMIRGYENKFKTSTKEAFDAQNKPKSNKFPTDGCCKSKSNELEQYLIKTRSNSDSKMSKERANGVGWNESSYWWLLDTDKSSKRQYHLSDLGVRLDKSKQPLKQAVHCASQEEWDFACDKLKCKSFCKFNELGDCIKVDNPGVSFFIRRPDNDYQILSFQEWCDLNGYKMENEVKFEVGKWYKYEKWYLKYLKHDNGVWTSSEYISDTKFYSKMITCFGRSNLDSEKILVSIEEIQQFLPNGHPDKNKNLIKNLKIGDWMVLGGRYSHGGYSVGDLIQIESLTGNEFTAKEKNSNELNTGFSLTLSRHATPEEINNHLISIGQIPAGEPLNTGIEPNKDGMFKYTTYNGTTHVGKTATVSGPLKMNLSIDDEELPMVNIIKTKTVNLLNLE